MAYAKKLDETSQSSEIQPDPWGERQKLIDSDIRNHMQFFKNSAMASEARGEDWELDLIRYVREVAEIQACMIHGAKVGYDSGILFGYAAKADWNKINAWLDEQRRLCAPGVIDVHIPTERLNAWKRSAVYWSTRDTNNGNFGAKARAYA